VLLYHLDLEQKYQHPQVAGWVRVFRNWVREEPFERIRKRITRHLRAAFLVRQDARLVYCIRDYFGLTHFCLGNLPILAFYIFVESFTLEIISNKTRGVTISLFRR
jgi:hypothetical protein